MSLFTYRLNTDWVGLYTDWWLNELFTYKLVAEWVVYIQTDGWMSCLHTYWWLNELVYIQTDGWMSWFIYRLMPDWVVSIQNNDWMRWFTYRLMAERPLAILLNWRLLNPWFKPGRIKSINVKINSCLLLVSLALAIS